MDEKIARLVQAKNEKYYKDLINYYNKNKKVKLNTRLNIFYKLNILIDKSGLNRGILINPISIIIYSISCFFVAFWFSYSIFGIQSLSMIVAIPAVFLPTFIINLIKEYNAKKIEKIMLDFLLQLKNYTKINNDIVYAFNQVKTINPLQKHINTFLLELNSGIKFEKAIENIKEKIEFNSLKTVFSNIEYCYIYGGDFSLLMDKSYKLINKIQKEKSSRIQETKSARIVLRNFNCFRFVCLFQFY